MGDETREQPESIRKRVEPATAPLTQDERTVLDIASRGESLIAIGRWEKPIKALVNKGLLQSHDMANNTITDAGLKACEAAEDEALTAYVEKAKEIDSAQRVAQKHAECAAQDLAKAARVSSRVQGDSPEQACRRWAVVVMERALEIIGGRS